MSNKTLYNTPSIRDNHIKKWWQNWNVADFSWDGLQYKKWRGWTVIEDQSAFKSYIEKHGLSKGAPSPLCQAVYALKKDDLPEGTPLRPANLQDYWRDQEEFLVKAGGHKKYTIAHLPLENEDGTPTWKLDPDHENWELLNQIITHKIAYASDPEMWKEIDTSGPLVEEYQVVLCDNRAQLDGCVLSEGFDDFKYYRHFENKPLLDYKDKAKLISELDLVEREANVKFDNCAFIDANFDKIKFGKYASFAKTLFIGKYATLNNVEFTGGDINFSNSSFCVDYANIEYSIFNGDDIKFSKAFFFVDELRFTGSKFISNVSFQNARFYGGIISFEAVEFKNSCHFSNSEFYGEYVRFDNAVFKYGANFTRSEFHAESILFDKSTFSSMAGFSNVVFSGGNVSFDGATFVGNADFSYVNFRSKNVSFETTAFAQRTKKNWNSMLLDSIDMDFASAIVENTISFKNAIFSPPGGTLNSFKGSQFLGVADFSRSLDFSQGNHPEFFPFNAFGYANFKNEVILPNYGERKEAEIFGLAIDKRNLNLAVDSQSEGKSGCKQKLEDVYHALEKGCTTLKRVMKVSSDIDRVQQFFKFEQIARNARPSTRTSVKILSNCYRLFADYGKSLTRPLITLFIFWLGFAAIYGIGSYSIGLRPQNNNFSLFWAPLEFSASQIFKPLYTWTISTPQLGDPSWLGNYINHLSPGGWLTVKFLASLQSFISIILIFLFGTATKRKFQIA